jgi:hypothetical protein
MQYLTVFLTKAYIFIDEAWFHMIGCISAQNNRNWSCINARQTFEGPFTIRRLVSGVLLLLHN